MDFLREIQMLYEAFYHLKSDITAKLDSLEKSVRRQESMYNVMDNIERKLTYIIPLIETKSSAEINPSPVGSLYMYDRSSFPEVNSAPPGVEYGTTISNRSRIFSSDTNLSYMKRKKNDMCFRNYNPFFKVASDCNDPTLERQSSEKVVPAKDKSHILLGEFESKPDSGLDSDSREQRSDSSSLHMEDDPLYSLLEELEQKAVVYQKEALTQQVADADRYTSLVHERSRVSAQKELANERLKTSILDKDNCLLRMKEMKRSIGTLEKDKEWLIGRLEENIANKKQVLGKIGGMHSQFVKKNRVKVENGSVSGKKAEIAKHPSFKMDTRELSQELKLKDILEEKSVVELRRKLIKSVVKNYALKSKFELEESKISSQTLGRSRVKNGTFTKVKAVAQSSNDLQVRSKVKYSSKSGSQSSLNSQNIHNEPDFNNGMTYVNITRDEDPVSEIQVVNGLIEKALKTTIRSPKT